MSTIAGLGPESLAIAVLDALERDGENAVRRRLAAAAFAGWLAVHPQLVVGSPQVLAAQRGQHVPHLAATLDQDGAVWWIVRCRCGAAQSLATEHSQRTQEPPRDVLVKTVERDPEGRITRIVEVRQ